MSKSRLTRVMKARICTCKEMAEAAGLEYVALSISGSRHLKLTLRNPKTKATRYIIASSSPSDGGRVANQFKQSVRLVINQLQEM